MLGNLMNALLQPGPGGQQSAGADLLSQVVGGLMGGQQGGSAPVAQMLGGLEQIIGGNPASGQPLPLNSGTATSQNNPLMGLLGPVATAVAGKTGISPAVATTVAGIAMHYLLSSHPAAGGNANIAQQVASGSISPATMQSSGMVNAVVQATGLSQADAEKSLNATMNHFQQHAQQHAENLKAGKRRRDES